MRFYTYDGGTVDVRAFGPLVQFELRNARGETTATVEMSERDAWELIYTMGDILERA